MKILIVSQHFYPEEFRINDIAVELVNRGHSVDVVTGLPNYPKGEIFEGYEKKLFENYLGVNVYRTKIRPRHTGSLNLFRNYMSFMNKAKKTVCGLTGPYDIIFSYETSPAYQIVPAIKAKKVFKAPLVCMCCDQWPESLKARGLEKGPIFKIISSQCKKIYNSCDYIINTSPSFVEYNNKVNKVPLEKMCWHQQHAEDNFANIDTKKEPSDIVDLMFAGNIGKVQNVSDIILAYNELKYSDLRIHIFGDGSSFDDCKKLIDDLKLGENVLLYGRVSNQELKKYYKNMDACLLTLSGKTAIGNTIPSKLQGYMSARKMVIGAINGDSRLIIDEAKCGIYTDADDFKKLAKLIDIYYKNKNKYIECGSNGRNYFEKNCSLNSFVDFLEGAFKSTKELY